MDDFIFLDTETTGNNLLSDRMFQLCYKHSGVIKSEYFKPEIEISIKSQSITHVTNKMVADKPRFDGSDFKKEVQNLVDKHIVVAHNAIFDIAMLAHEGVTVPRFICTLKVARALDPDGVIPEYNLQYLRYYLDLDVKANAHEAEDDVKVLEALFGRLYKKMKEKVGSHEEAVLEMLKLTTEPSLFMLFPFGKHRGRKIDEVIIIDRPYVEWLLEKKLENPENEEDWIFTLKHHLRIN
jgi:exodeoxyribonuclease X